MSNSWEKSLNNPTFFEDLYTRRMRESEENLRRFQQLRDSAKSKPYSNFAKKLPNVDCFVKDNSSQLENYLKKLTKFLQIAK